MLVRHRVGMRRQVSRLKIKLRRVLANYNADRRDLFTAAGSVYLKEVSATLSPADRFVLKQLQAALAYAEKQLRQAQLRLRQFAKKALAREPDLRARLGAEARREIVAHGGWRRNAGLVVARAAGVDPPQPGNAESQHGDPVVADAV